MELAFVKLEGNGNDFILIDEYTAELVPEEMKASFSELYCDRRFGIGGDGVLFLGKGTDTDLTMRLFQPDASEAEMCGNGIRCLVRYAYDAKYITSSCTVKTLAGTIAVGVSHDEDDDFLAEVEMPPAAFDAALIPARGTGPFHAIIAGHHVYAAKIGVPHAVVFVDELDSFPVHEVGSQIRNDDVFPEGANVNFVEIIGDNEISVRTFERGVEGETFSCGSGSTAAAAVSHRLRELSNEIEVETLGGPLTIRIDGDRCWLKGPAEVVFYGVLIL
ncbi:MAG: diaminopimelate epimerase [Euryarchaeota archaeon]|nr:diaminopimelate epimerase [Euryarchaeota archaeon]